MKNKIIFSNLLLALLGLSFYFFSAYAQSISVDLSNSLKVNIKSPKSVYILGEVIPINVELRNEGSSDISLNGTDAQSGYLKVLISNSPNDFKEYTNAAWGNKKQPRKTLRAGQRVQSQATVLVNVVPEVSHLNEDAAKRESKGKIMTGYAFPKAGVYFIKTVLHIPGENPIILESDSIQIMVNEPVGEDLEVWNKIKDRADIAYFLQESQSIAHNYEEREKFAQEVEQIAKKHPTGTLASQINRSLEKFRASELKRKEFRDNLRQQRKN